jgi:hypothetical protein
MNGSAALGLRRGNSAKQMTRERIPSLTDKSTECIGGAWPICIRLCKPGKLRPAGGSCAATRWA